MALMPVVSVTAVGEVGSVVALSPKHHCDQFDKIYHIDNDIYYKYYINNDLYII